jgi:hypothetical protein
MPGKFKKLVKKLEDKGLPASEAGGIAYKEGVKKYGKTGMKKKAVAGRKRATKKTR